MPWLELNPSNGKQWDTHLRRGATSFGAHADYKRFTLWMKSGDPIIARAVLGMIFYDSATCDRIKKRGISKVVGPSSPQRLLPFSSLAL